MKRRILILTVILVLLFNGKIYCQLDSSAVDKAKLYTVIGAETALYSGVMVGLYYTWYKNYPLSSFHFFNDNNQWRYVDKVGHAATGYYVGKAGYDVLRWANVSEKKSIWLGGTLGLFYLMSFEALDGVSTYWGASVGDMVANVAGSGLFIGQQLLWKEQRVLLKYSYWESSYRAARPDAFGENFAQQLIKDYNGQTYWLSFNLRSFMKKTKIPRWLNVAIGYGGRDMKYGSPGLNTWECDEGKCVVVLPHNSSFLLSADIDLTKIKSKKKLINALLGTFGFIKIPFPAVIYNTNFGWSVHPFYF